MSDHDNDELATRHLAALMNDVDPPGPAMEVDGLLVAGRRGARRHRALMAGSTAAAVAVMLAVGGAVTAGVHATGQGPAPAAGPSTSAKPTGGTKPSNPATTAPATTTPATAGGAAASCTIQTLPSPVALAGITSIDPTGHYVAGTTADGRLIVWTNGVPALFRPPAGMVDDAQVNSNGVVLIQTEVGDTPVLESFVKTGSTFARLVAPPHFPNASGSIDSAGNIAGTAADAKGLLDAPVFWPAGHPDRPQVLPAPQAQYGADVYGIGDNGIVSGNVSDGDYAYYWDSNHHGHKLTTPHGYTAAKAYASAGDWIVGYVAVNGNPVGTRWNIRTGKVEVFNGNNLAVAVNSAGDFVGDPFESPYLVRGNKVIDLPVPASETEGGVVGMTNDARTVLGSFDDGHTKVGILWHC